VKHMLEYLEANVLPEDQKEARNIVVQAPSFVYSLYFIDG